MPLWQVFHPKGAYTAEDKQGLAERITGLFTSAPMARLLRCGGVHRNGRLTNYYVGAKPTKNFVRFKVDQMANTLPSQLARRMVDAPCPSMLSRPMSEIAVYDSEVQIDEPGP